MLFWEEEEAAVGLDDPVEDTLPTGEASSFADVELDVLVWIVGCGAKFCCCCWVGFTVQTFLLLLLFNCSGWFVLFETGWSLGLLLVELDLSAGFGSVVVGFESLDFAGLGSCTGLAPSLVFESHTFLHDSILRSRSTLGESGPFFAASSRFAAISLFQVWILVIMLGLVGAASVLSEAGAGITGAGWAGAVLVCKGAGGLATTGFTFGLLSKTGFALATGLACFVCCLAATMLLFESLTVLFLASFLLAFAAWLAAAAAALAALSFSAFLLRLVITSWKPSSSLSFSFSSSPESFALLALLLLLPLLLSGI